MSAHAGEIDERIADWTAERTRAEIIDVFEAHEAALGPVYSMADVFEGEHFDARDAVIVVNGDGEQRAERTVTRPATTGSRCGASFRNSARRPAASTTRGRNWAHMPARCCASERA